MNKKTKVIHLSTVHSWQDPRIFLKECRSLSNAGYEVHLITPDGIDEKRDDVHIHKLNYEPENRLDRFFKASSEIFSQSLSLKPNIIHFHDPELIPQALKLKKKSGIPIIYDIHEDNVTAIQHREYIPSFLKPFLIWLVKYFEKKAANELSIIIAEQYYKNRFENSTSILNYPDLTWMKKKTYSQELYPGILYTGNVREDRGALHHARILSKVDDIKLWSIGKCTSALFSQMKQEAGEREDAIIAKGIDGYVRLEEIVEIYKSRNWLAGLAIFPKSEHVKEKQLTKFFEYMAAGIPIVYSDFPKWCELLEPLDVGIAVDPENLEEVIEAIKLLQYDKNIWQRKSMNGQEVVKNFSWKCQEKKLFKFYERF
jgi:glycosyltransferase involved in cell wall biosynthesis